MPADSSAMLNALRKLGNVTRLQTKTSVVLSPRVGKRSWHVREAIKSNLHPIKGNAFYVNLRTTKAFQIGRKTKWLWRSAP